MAVGVRPTVGDLIKPVLEVHLLDFNQLIYGQRIHVEFKKKIREEQTFASLDAMVTKIHSDIALARQYFAEV
jgi:riboflavin kinase/FMN adenylyltransferase